MADKEVVHNELGWAYIILFWPLAMCGCGQFGARLALLKETLEAMPLYESKKDLDYLKTPLGEWLLSIITHAELIEHGTSIGGSWLTDMGFRFLKCLEDLDALEAYIDEHGMCECPECDGVLDGFVKVSRHTS